MHTQDRTGLAIILSLIALTLFDGMGLIIKHLSNNYSATELTAWRNIFGLIPTLIALWSSRKWRTNGKVLKIRQWKLALLRGAIVTFAQVSFYISLGLMAFATASTISYATALFTTALAIPVLGERVGWVRWSAVLVGFLGVIMVIQPGAEGFSSYTLFPLAAAVFYALVGVTARLFDDDVPSAVVNLYSSFSSVVGAVLITYFWGGFNSITSTTDMVWIILMGGLGGTAVLLLVISYRMTEQSNLAPFSYFGIPLSFVLGWLFFNEAPWNTLFPGGILIAAAGLLIVWRERSQDKNNTLR
ncbi:DMT family transporter [Paracoccaceae bacterium]|nr:DMT family transporter [Paracoccaceae bacterium]